MLPRRGPYWSLLGRGAFQVAWASAAFEFRSRRFSASRVYWFGVQRFDAARVARFWAVSSLAVLRLSFNKGAGA